MTTYLEPEKFNRLGKKFLAKGITDMSNIQGSINQIDEVIAKELTIDLSSGAFYKEVDDETLQMALVAMYENIEGWNQRGVIIGVG